MSYSCADVVVVSFTQVQRLLYAEVLLFIVVEYRNFPLHPHHELDWTALKLADTQTHTYDA